MNVLRTLLAVAFFIGIAGCASERRLVLAEKSFDTDGPITSLYHSALYYPSEISLRFDGYILGIEKIPRARISADGEIKIASSPESGINLKTAEAKLNDGKFMTVTHIIKTNTSNGGVNNCAVFNAYSTNAAEKSKQLTEDCKDNQQPVWPVNSAYANSWKAMGLLQESIKTRLKNDSSYTHILVIVMGWNTVQEEAIRNFNSLTVNLQRANTLSSEKSAQLGSTKTAADQLPFKPLVIGVTWPSQWNNKWFDPAIKILSFGTKADDADEVGLTWLGVLLHQTLPNSIGDRPVILIGHSFGSRAASVGACMGPAIVENSPQPLRTIDTVINFQGAFRADRLFGVEDKGLSFPKGCPKVSNFVLTSSVHDSAVRMAFWGTYAGGAKSYKNQCGKGDGKINCGTARATGEVDLPLASISNITYVDADLLIKDDAYETGGGAHSDIYRREHGIFIDRVLRKKFNQPNREATTTGLPKRLGIQLVEQ